MTALPVENMGFTVHKRAFTDATFLRYVWNLTAAYCVCESAFSTKHTLRWVFPIHHLMRSETLLLSFSLRCVMMCALLITWASPCIRKRLQMQPSWSMDGILLPAYCVCGSGFSTKHTLRGVFPVHHLMRSDSVLLSFSLRCVMMCALLITWASPCIREHLIMQSSWVMAGIHQFTSPPAIYMIYFTSQVEWSLLQIQPSSNLFDTVSWTSALYSLLDLDAVFPHWAE